MIDLLPGLLAVKKLLKRVIEAANFYHGASRGQREIIGLDSGLDFGLDFRLDFILNEVTI